MAYQSGDSLLSIIDDILDFSKLESGTLQLESVNFDLQDFLHDTAELLAKQAHEKGLSLDCIPPQGPSLVVCGDPLRLRQILANLIGNAIKFTQQGNVLLRVTAANDGAEHLNVGFEVVDTGIGISLEQQKRIFDSFAQEDDSTTRRFGGTGLGLSISKQFVEAMGGKLRVVSEPGKGSAFSFDLRMPAGDEVDLVVTKRFLKKELSSLATRLDNTELLVGQILVVDDNEVNRAVASFMLTDLGIEIDIAEDGVQALEKFSSGSFDAILMDCQMPKLDGLQATQAIRQMESESGEDPVPIIAVTASAIIGESEKCIAAGMNDFLSKPYTSKQLYSILSKYLQHQA
jgi:CheY-like chemotaxis protein